MLSSSDPLWSTSLDASFVSSLLETEPVESRQSVLSLLIVASSSKEDSLTVGERVVGISHVVDRLVILRGLQISFLEDQPLALISELKDVSAKSRADIKAAALSQILTQEVEGNRSMAYVRDPQINAISKRDKIKIFDKCCKNKSGGCAWWPTFSISYLHLNAFSGDITRGSRPERGVVDSKVMPTILNLNDACNLGIRRFCEEFPTVDTLAELLDQQHIVLIEVWGDRHSAVVMHRHERCRETVVKGVESSDNNWGFHTTLATGMAQSIG